MTEKIINPFRQNVLNTVINALNFELPHTKAFKITENTRLDEDLDIQYFAICFFILALENITLLDLDVNIDSLSTIGDICDLVEQRFAQADKNLLNQKLFVTKILPALAFNKPIQTSPQPTVEQLQQNKGKTTMNLLEGYTHKIEPISVFYNIKQILLIQNHKKAINLSMNMYMVKDLKIFGSRLANLVTEIQERYQMPVLSRIEIQKAQKLKDLCTICANDFNLQNGIRQR